MAQTKIYQSIRFHTLDTYVMVDGKQHLIEFRGGTLKPDIKGKFTTNDPKLIKALDNDSGNGNSFKCIGVIGKKDPKPDNFKSNPPEGTDEPAQSGEEHPDTPDTKVDQKAIIADGISTVQGARDYLVSNVDGLTASKLPNKAAILNAAKANNIVFPHLPKD